MLVILMGSIGDVARGLTIASGLKRAFPETKLSWLVEPTCAPLVRANPLIDEVLVFERRTPLQGVIKLRGELRERSFDVTLDLQRHLKSGFFSWLSGASRRIGFHPRDSKEGNWLFQTEYIEAAPKDYSKLRHYQLFLKALGITPPSEPEFVPAAPTTAEASALMREAGAPFVLFVLGSSWESKNWFGE
jgi:ADP-heptose:LPS heptosyltransferase